MVGLFPLSPIDTTLQALMKGDCSRNALLVLGSPVGTRVMIRTLNSFHFQVDFSIGRPLNSGGLRALRRSAEERPVGITDDSSLRVKASLRLPYNS